MSKSYIKVLTKNDAGETGGHQAGIVVPRQNKELIDFFPTLDLNQFNPDAWITCIDPEGEQWKMRYVYYNGKTFNPPQSTRNEYRITYMTKFFSKWGAQAGDSVLFTSTSKQNAYMIQVKKNSLQATENLRTEPKTVILTGWRPIF